MGIKLNVHKTHRQFTDGSEVVDVEGVTVGECLLDLVKKFPKMKE